MYTYIYIDRILGPNGSRFKLWIRMRSWLWSLTMWSLTMNRQHSLSWEQSLSHSLIWLLVTWNMLMQSLSLQQRLAYDLL